MVAVPARDAYAQALTVNSIIVQGNQRVETETIDRISDRGRAADLTRFRSMKA